MGFTLSEIKLFLNGLRDDVPVGPRWKRLGNRKIQEVEEGIQRGRRLKSLLEHLLHCRCGSLGVCVEGLSLSPSLRLIGGAARSKVPLRRNPVRQFPGFAAVS
jgi:MerR, DNA binding